MSASANDGKAEQTTVTAHDVIPILLLRCTVCHGRQHQDGGLDLRSTASILKGGDSGPAIVPGEPENSLILKRIVAEQMPPRKRLIEVSVKPMQAAEIDLLTRWIEAGAPTVETDTAESDEESLVSDDDRDFWAFQPPPNVTVPQVQDGKHIRNSRNCN